MTESQDKKKYTSGIRKIFVQKLLKKVLSEIIDSNAKNILDVGCGEGFPDRFLLDRDKDLKIVGIDSSSGSLMKAKKKNPEAEYQEGDIYNLEQFSHKFDLILAMEILEHLTTPEKALAQIQFPAQKAIISVPYEPWFSIFSLFLGKYVKSLGRHPDHVNCWNKKTLTTLLKKYYPQVKILFAFPWLIGICKK